MLVGWSSSTMCDYCSCPKLFCCCIITSWVSLSAAKSVHAQVSSQITRCNLIDCDWPWQMVAIGLAVLYLQKKSNHRNAEATLYHYKTNIWKLEAKLVPSWFDNVAFKISQTILNFSKRQSGNFNLTLPLKWCLTCSVMQIKFSSLLFFFCFSAV